MKTKRKESKLVFLPNYFRKIGLITIIVALFALLGLVTRIMTDNFQNFHKGLALLFFICLMLGLLFLTFSREKQEDEMSLFLRFRAMASSFIFAILYTLADGILALTQIRDMGKNTAVGLVIAMLIFYNLIYYTSKRSMNEKLDKGRKGEE